MTITRNIAGVKLTIELTPLELNAAYYEERDKLDYGDVLTFADMCDDNYKGQPYIDTIRDHEVAKLVAAEYRRLLDLREDDEYWTEVMSEAVMNVGDKLTRKEID